MLGHMPLEITLHGSSKRFRLSHDILLSKEYRGKGIGRILPMGAISRDGSLAGALWFNEPNYRMYKKGGWQDVPNLIPYVKIYNPISFVQKINKSKAIAGCLSIMARFLLRAKNVLCSKDNYEDIEIDEIEIFDGSHDRFFDSISPHFGFIVGRKHEYLNWKFVQRPFHHYRCYKALNKKKELSGYMVIKKEVFGSRKRGKIVDILADPSQVRIFPALIHKANLELANPETDYISIICPYPPFKRELARLGFMKARTQENFMVKNWERDYDKSFISNIDNWYLTYSDGDGDAWQVD
jgi:hypothetical protein